MSSSTSIGVVADLFEAAARDPADVDGFLAPEIRWHVCAGAEHAFTGTFSGAAGMARYRRLVQAEGGGTFHTRLRSVSPIGDDVVSCVVDVEFEADQAAQRFSVAWVCRVLDGRIVEVWDVVPRVPDAVLRAARRAVEAVDRST